MCSGNLERVCGRYAASQRPENLAEEFEVDRVLGAEGWEADYNVAPTKIVPAVLARRPKADLPPTGGVQPVERQLRLLRWGLVPSWASDPGVGARMINARVETVATKPAFRRAVARRRCLLPADGYYEWYAVREADGGPERAGRRPRKQPFFIRPAEGGALAMAGIYELWRDRTVDEQDPAAWLWTAAVITTAATDEVGQIHDRMPLVVPRSRWSEWLDPAGNDPALLTRLLEPAVSVRLEAYPVSPAVSSVRNNGPHLVEPVPVEEPPPTTAPVAPANLRLF